MVRGSFFVDFCIFLSLLEAFISYFPHKSAMKKFTLVFAVLVFQNVSGICGDTFHFKWDFSEEADLPGVHFIYEDLVLEAATNSSVVSGTVELYLPQSDVIRWRFEDVEPVAPVSEPKYYEGDFGEHPFGAIRYGAY